MQNKTTASVTYTMGAATALGVAAVSPQAASTSPQEEVVKVGASQSSGTTSGYVDERVFEAKIDALKADTRRHVEVAEAKTETKFAQLISKIDGIATNLGSLDVKVSDLRNDVSSVKTDVQGAKDATASVKWNILATGLALGGLIFGLFAFGGQMFELATSLVGIGR